MLERILSMPSASTQAIAAMGLQRGVLDPLGREGALIADCGRRQRGRDIAEFTMGFRNDVARGAR